MSLHTPFDGSTVFQSWPLYFDSVFNCLIASLFLSPFLLFLFADFCDHALLCSGEAKNADV